MPQPIHILHLHSTFALGGKEARAVRLMNAFGGRARHTIVSGMPEQLDARAAIAPGIKYEIAQNPPLTVQGIKQVLNARSERDAAESLRTVAMWNAAHLPSQDLGEAMAAFVQRRPPKFTGR